MSDQQEYQDKLSDDYYEADDWDEEDFDCGAMRDMNHRMVGCSMAGTEECDFECPYREIVERSLRAQAAWQRRREREAKQGKP
jgi:hypothetical protein